MATWSRKRREEGEDGEKLVAKLEPRRTLKRRNPKTARRRRRRSKEEGNKSRLP
jgi:hypothetical protein